MGGDPETLYARELISTSASGDWIGRPSIIDDGSKWIMTYRAASQHSYDATGRVHIRFSTDQGNTWTAEDTYTDSNPVSGAPFAGDGTNDINCPVVIKAPNGNLLLCATEQEAVYTVSSFSIWRSTDGGASWTDLGVKSTDGGIDDAIIIGTDIYIVTYTEDDTNPPNGSKSVLLKSTDNGGTWTKVCDITTWEADNVNVDESSICNPSGNILIVIMRSRGATERTYLRISTDLGATWGSVINLTDQLGVILRPRLRIFTDEPNRIYLVGCDYDSGTGDIFTIVSYSNNNGTTWNTPSTLEPITQVDAGYADILKRTNDLLYIVSYRGTNDAATIWEYIVHP